MLSIRHLIGSPRRLFVAVLLFVLLDLTVLATNLWIVAQVSRDAVAINLAGRQRMLSQKLTKSLLLTQHSSNPVLHENALAEVRSAFSLFDKTLTAFATGGTTESGDGGMATLQKVQSLEGQESIEKTRLLLDPIKEKLTGLLATGALLPADAVWAVDYMNRHNLEILAHMNKLTSALEQDSIERIGVLRIIQTTAFLLAMANFLVIVLALVRQYKHVEADGQRWQKLAQRDVLTGLHNRAAFNSAIEQATEMATAQSSAFCVLMLDLDGFKKINDTYGHAAGDILLKHVGTALQQVARESDITARLGGDEFALLCPNMHTQEHIEHFCERIVASIDVLTEAQGEQARVGVSVGAAVFPSHGTRVDELMAAADHAMYQSKRQGGRGWAMATLNR